MVKRRLWRDLATLQLSSTLRGLINSRETDFLHTLIVKGEGEMVLNKKRGGLS